MIGRSLRIGRSLGIVAALLMGVMPAFADEGGRNVRHFNSEAASDASCPC